MGEILVSTGPLCGSSPGSLFQRTWPGLTHADGSAVFNRGQIPQSFKFWRDTRLGEAGEGRPAIEGPSAAPCRSDLALRTR
jgi:hypothetical protein